MKINQQLFVVACIIGWKWENYPFFVVYSFLDTIKFYCIEFIHNKSKLLHFQKEISSERSRSAVKGNSFRELTFIDRKNLCPSEAAHSVLLPGHWACSLSARKTPAGRLCNIVISIPRCYKSDKRGVGTKLENAIGLGGGVQILRGGGLRKGAGRVPSC